MEGTRYHFLRDMTDERIRRNSFLVAQTSHDALVPDVLPTHGVVHRPPGKGRALDAVFTKAARTSDVNTPHAPGSQPL